MSNKNVIRFGDNNEWAVSTDDGCLQFHPQFEEHPEKISSWIWKEAWDFVESQGGFEVVRNRLKN
jgi:hypothetical protein